MCLTIKTNWLLQISYCVDGWGYGWRVSNPGRHGYFPISAIRKLDSKVGSLWDRQELELPAVSAEALKEHALKVGKPPALPVLFKEEPPEVVKQSSTRSEQTFKEQVAQQLKMANAGDEEDTAASKQEDALQSVLHVEIPECFYPFVVCRKAFTPPAS